MMRWWRRRRALRERLEQLERVAATRLRLKDANRSVFFDMTFEEMYLAGRWGNSWRGDWLRGPTHFQVVPGESPIPRGEAGV